MTNITKIKGSVHHNESEEIIEVVWSLKNEIFSKIAFQTIFSIYFLLGNVIAFFQDMSSCIHIQNAWRKRNGIYI